MIRFQAWIPDTCPEMRFVTRWDDENPDAPHVCIEARRGGDMNGQGGEVLKDPHAVYEQALSENRAKNEALQILLKSAPPERLKALLDEDGDFVIDEEGAPIAVFKNKFAPVLEITPLGEPNVIRVKGFDATEVAALDKLTPEGVSIREA